MGILVIIEEINRYKNIVDRYVHWLINKNSVVWWSAISLVWRIF
jgi:uncharacterized protein YaaR (DUF327 family)